MRVKKTNAARLLDRAGIAYELRSYELAKEDFSAEATARLVGLPAAAVFKTLVTTGPRAGPCFAVIPGGTQLDLRSLAVNVQERKMQMVPVADIMALTGYRRGAVTVEFMDYRCCSN